MTAQKGSVALHLLLDVEFSADDPPRLRLSMAACAVRAGLAEPRRGEFLLAVHEVVENAIRHGGGHLLLHHRDGTLHCQVKDAGPGFPDRPIANGPPDADAETGCGLWLAQQLADEVTIASESTGSTVTVSMAVTDSGEPVRGAPRDAIERG
jgi:anti-sigma regulatory factor (Ser/Thr protein kinase)